MEPTPLGFLSVHRAALESPHVRTQFGGRGWLQVHVMLTSLMGPRTELHAPWPLGAGTP